jgi:uncharacterized phage protein (TIGR02220 family)
MENKPNYFSILPASVRYDKELTALAKLLFSELTALANKSGKAYPTNKYLSELYGVSKTTISTAISSLENKGYILVDIDRNPKGTFRYITPLMNPMSENLKGGVNNLKGGCKKTDSPLSENLKPKEYNKNNNTSKNIIYLEETKTILNLFQELTGVGYRLPSASKVEAYGGYKLCKARLQENDLDAILAVVRFKCGQWLQQPKMRQYCTYQTILRKNNFDKYLAEFSISQNNNFTSHEQTNSNKPSSLLNGLAELQARLSQKNNTGA